MPSTLERCCHGRTNCSTRVRWLFRRRGRMSNVLDVGAAAGRPVSGLPAESLPQFRTPLCVDLDGTLIATDVLWESLVLLVKWHPRLLLSLPFWFLRGKAHLKQQLARRVVPM